MLFDDYTQDIFTQLEALRRRLPVRYRLQEIRREHRALKHRARLKLNPRRARRKD